MVTDICWAKDVRPQKERVRNRLLRNNGRLSSVLFLPGNESLCVKQALRSGMIDSETIVHAIERDPETAALIDVDLKKMRLNYILHNGELTDYRPKIPLSHAFIDLMGPLDSDIAHWLRNLQIMPGFSLSLIVPMNWRNSDYMRGFEKSFRENPLLEKLQMEEGVYMRYAIIYMALLKVIFNEYTFDFEWTIRYRDSRLTMLAFKMINFVPCESGWPSLDSVSTCLTKERNKMSSSTVSTISKTSAAAHKAWATRRTNGWVHPSKKPANPAISKTSMAAFKAWETRRANGWVHPSKLP